MAKINLDRLSAALKEQRTKSLTILLDHPESSSQLSYQIGYINGINFALDLLKEEYRISLKETLNASE